MSDKELFFLVYEKLKKAIETIKSKDISPSTNSLNTLQSELGIIATAPNLSDFCAFAEDVIGWIPLNPNDIHRVKALVSTYHLPGYEYFNPETSTLECPHPVTKEYKKQTTNILSNNKLPTKDGLIALFYAVTQSTNQFIGISGRRGSGKTIALNFFLVTAHRSLSLNGIIWFRTDVAKLWEYESGYLNVTQYTILHSIYIGLKYSGQDQNLAALKNNGKEFTNYLLELSETYPSLKKVFLVWNSLLDSYTNVIRKSIDDINGKPVTDFLREGRQIILEHGDYVLENVYSEMIAFLRRVAQKEGKSLKILIILDGIDNIRVAAEQDRYFNFLSEIDKLFSGTPLKVGDKFLLVARPETFIDLIFLKTTMLNGSHVPIKFDVDSDFIMDLLKKKSNAIERPVEYFQQTAESYTGSRFIDTDKSRDFTRSLEYLLAIFKYTTKTSIDSKSASTKPIDLIFDGNLRSLLRNSIRAHHHKIRLSNVNVSRVRTLFEGSVLAGCNSMPKNFDDTVHGHWCPNLFEYATIQKGHWTGLIVVRLIQLMSAVKIGVTREEAIYFLNKYFGYDVTIADTAFQIIAEYSLIRGVNHKFVGFDDNKVRPKKTRLYSITEKGRYLLKQTFKDYAIFYFMAVGTPLDFERLKSKGIDLKLFTHSLEPDRHFFRAAILSGLILWAHIFTAVRQERNAFGRNMMLNKDGQLVPSSAFDLPGIYDWPNSAMKLLNRLHKRDLQDISDVLDRYISSL